MLRRLRPALPIVTELAGIGALVAAAWLFNVLLGLVVLGAALIYIAQGV